MLTLKCTTFELAVNLISAKILLSPFDLQFRLHTSIGRLPWAKLWYCLRALDQEGKGYYEIPIALAELLTDSDEKTIYRWLKAGELKGAFRRYKVRRGTLKVWLGGLFAVCEKLNCANWGTVTVTNLLDLGSIRPLVTATVSQRLQQGSRYAANSKLHPKYRKEYGAPNPSELFQEIEQSSLKKATNSPYKGQVPYLLHISNSRIFVSRNFTAFGVSQNAISCKLGIHKRTVQRHQASLGMTRRQLCQAKQEYAQIESSLKAESTEVFTTDKNGIPNPNLGYKTALDGSIRFLDGLTPGAKKRSAPNQWTMPAGSLSGRLFAIGRKRKSWFMAKCNIYREDLQLKTMWASREAFERRLKLAASGTVTAAEKNEPAGVPDDLTIVTGIAVI
jgi:hypothetical protein